MFLFFFKLALHFSKLYGCPQCLPDVPFSALTQRMPGEQPFSFCYHLRPLPLDPVIPGESTQADLVVARPCGHAVASGSGQQPFLESHGFGVPPNPLLRRAQSALLGTASPSRVTSGGNWVLRSHVGFPDDELN